MVLLIRIKVVLSLILINRNIVLTISIGVLNFIYEKNITYDYLFNSSETKMFYYYLRIRYI